MELITNFGESRDHFERLRLLARGADELVVVSPFLSRDLQNLLAKLPLAHLKSFRLVTTLEPNSVAQLYTSDSLESLVDFFQNVLPQVEWRVDLADDLHGKLYLFSQSGRMFAAIVTSANFTQNGLRLNREWGIAVREEALLADIQASLAKLRVRTLSLNDIRGLIDECERFRASRTTLVAETIQLDLNSALTLESAIGASVGTVWLKPEGTAEEPIEVGTPYDAPEKDLHFPKVRPSGVHVGDTIVAYGVGVRRLLGVYRVSGSIAHATDEQIALAPWKARWPWYVPSANLTRHFGASWWTCNLFLSNLEAVFRKSHPGVPLTAVGGHSLGTLNYGGGKVRLSDSFGAFLVASVLSATPATAL